MDASFIIMSQLEKENLNAICDYLALKKYVFWRNNTTPIYDKTKQIFRRMPKYGMRGVSDIILLLDGKAWFLEVKAEKGKQSPDQRRFQDMVEKTGNYYKVVRTIEDLEKLGF